MKIASGAQFALFKNERRSLIQTNIRVRVVQRRQDTSTQLLHSTSIKSFTIACMHGKSLHSLKKRTCACVKYGCYTNRDLWRYSIWYRYRISDVLVRRWPLSITWNNGYWRLTYYKIQLGLSLRELFESTTQIWINLEKNLEWYLCFVQTNFDV